MVRGWPARQRVWEQRVLPALLAAVQSLLLCILLCRYCYVVAVQ